MTCLCFFFFNDTATTEIYTLSLHDALPICRHLERRAPRRRPVGAGRIPGRGRRCRVADGHPAAARRRRGLAVGGDRKSTRLNSSHANISYAVFCLKKKKITAGSNRPLRQLT